MKSNLLCTTAAMALAMGVAGAAFAQGASSGHVSANIGRTDVDFGGGADTDFTTWGANGAFFVPASERWNLQFNVDYSYWDVSPSSIDTLRGDVHAFTRASERYAAGGFLTAADFDGTSFFGGGVEGDLYRDNYTLGGEVGYFDGEMSTNVAGACGHLRWYGSERFSLEGQAGFGEVETGGADSNAYGIGGEAEYQFTGSPISVYGGASYSSLDDFNVDTTSLRLGVRWNIGTADLVQRDHEGASMRGASCVMALRSF